VDRAYDDRLLRLPFGADKRREVAEKRLIFRFEGRGLQGSADAAGNVDAAALSVRDVQGV